MAVYATVAELKARVNITSTDASRDSVLSALLAAASGAIDQFCNRPDGFLAASVASARTYAGRGAPFVWIDECTEITAVAVKDAATDTTYTAWATTDWVAFSGSPDAPDFNRTPYTGIMTDPNGNYDTFTAGEFITRRGFRPSSGVGRAVPTVQVTARWGYANETPAQVREAAITTAARWYKRGESSWADAMSNGEMGQLIYRRSLDADVEMMLSRYVLPAIGGRR